ncbi:Ion channel [compost metagenome]
MLIGEFDDYTTAVYHSGVNFATLGYGDMVMSPSWRLLGPMEAANGILMFGVSTAVMTAAVMDVIKHTVQSLEKRAGR